LFIFLSEIYLINILIYTNYQSRISHIGVCATHWRYFCQYQISPQWPGKCILEVFEHEIGSDFSQLGVNLVKLVATQIKGQGTEIGNFTINMPDNVTFTSIV